MEQDTSFVTVEDVEFFDIDAEFIDISVASNDHTFYVSNDNKQWIETHNSDFPDIDSDFADRDLLIKILKDKFGDNDVLPISNYNTFQLKSLVKDISRFFGISFQEVNDATKTLDHDVRKATLKQGDDKNLFQLLYDPAIEHCEPFREFIELHPEVGAPIKTLFKENKSLGKHAGGVIITEDVPKQMPVILSRKEPQTPWVEGMHFKHLEHLGWIKFDLLGLETLRIIQRCIELILQRHSNNKLRLEFDNGEIVECFVEQQIKLVSGTFKTIGMLDEDDDVASPVEII